jgi:predicted 2-oxoglutarate/Fe(II)-dependent dioxygenase YbiX/peroxiredoxin
MAGYREVGIGDPAPWFVQATLKNPQFRFDTVGGRYVVLCFFGSAASAAGKHCSKAVAENRGLFDDDKMAYFGVTNDPEDRPRLREYYPGIRYFLDIDGSVSRQYGVMDIDTEETATAETRPRWFVLSPTLQILKVVPVRPDGAEAPALMQYLRELPPIEAFTGEVMQAPILLVPNVFEPEFCKRLVDLYEARGGIESSFMRQVGEKTVYVADEKHKRRKDYVIEEEDIKDHAANRVRRRVIPQIMKAHQFLVTRMERYIVACYDAADGGHFAAHRDNTTKATEHRRFAASINLNSEFEGGEVFFPEYGRRSFKPPVGAAVVFSCSLLHQVTKVTKGRRYAFLPFLYDDAAATVRQENSKYLERLDEPEPEPLPEPAGAVSGE